MQKYFDYLNYNKYYCVQNTQSSLKQKCNTNFLNLNLLKYQHQFTRV